MRLEARTWMEPKLPPMSRLKTKERGRERESKKENQQNLELSPNGNHNHRSQGLRKGCSLASWLRNVRCWEEKGLA